MHAQDTTPVVALRLGAGELAALTQIADTDAARATADRLKLGELVDDATALRIGLSALVARGLAQIDGERIATTEEGTVVARALSEATGWVEIGLMAGSEADGALIAVGPVIGMLFGAAGGETYDLIPLASTVSVGETIAGIVFSFVSEREPAVASVEVHRSGVSQRIAVIRRGGGWEYRSGDDGLTVATGQEAFTEPDIRAALIALWDSAG